jgi:hypothetical protein
MALRPASYFEMGITERPLIGRTRHKGSPVLPMTTGLVTRLVNAFSRFLAAANFFDASLRVEREGEHVREEGGGGGRGRGNFRGSESGRV